MYEGKNIGFTSIDDGLKNCLKINKKNELTHFEANALQVNSES